MPEARPDQDRSVPEVVADLWQLSVAYAKQETVEPVKGLGRFLAYGVAGALCLGLGCTLLALAGLRALQTETGSRFTGNWSWAPYLFVVLGAAILIVLAVSRIGGRKK